LKFQGEGGRKYREEDFAHVKCFLYQLINLDRVVVFSPVLRADLLIDRLEILQNPQ
jgi:hypothetical protein